MSPKSFAVMPMDRLSHFENKAALDWLWDGYLARGNLTLLTSLWKAGKTTLVAGLLRALQSEGEFLGRHSRLAKALVVSEESCEHWVERLRLIPVGPHSGLMPRPFLTRPTPTDWNELIHHALDRRAAGDLDLFVVDPLASFLPGHSESDAGTLLEMLHPLQRLAQAGVAVLILHHPRKKSSDEGNAARGSGALLGFVDIILELHYVGHLRSDERRRRLVGRSRHLATPRRLVYEFDPESGAFAAVDNPHRQRFRENWDQVRSILERRESAATHQDLLADWPSDSEKPAASALYEWLNLAHDEKLVRREGAGRRLDPFRYRLPNEDDEYRDRGELPPLRDLEEAWGTRR
jgi:RecA-family ATPase